MQRLIFGILITFLLNGCDETQPGGGAVALTDMNSTGIDGTPSDTAVIPDTAQHSLDAGDAGTLDIGQMDAEPALSDPCAERMSTRPTQLLGATGCELERPMAGAAPLRGVVVSGDSLLDALSTSMHEPEHFSSLKEAGADFVWLMVTWRGIEPLDGTYDGAYMGRICGHAEGAAAAGLMVFLGMYQSGLGTANAQGIPNWLRTSNSDQPTAWRTIWARYSDRIVTAWTRLLASCEGRLVLTGLQPMTSPLSSAPEEDARIVTGLFNRIFEEAELRFGTLLRLVEPLSDGANVWVPLWAPTDPNLVYAPAAWSPLGPAMGAALQAPLVGRLITTGRSLGMPTIVRGVAGNSDEIFDANVRAVEEGGHSIAAWHDGFGTPLALRSADGEPNNIWGTFFSRPWPTQVPGHQLSFGMTEQGWTLQWRSNRDGVELVRVKLGALGPTVVATPAISDLVDFVQAYDPSTETLSLLIEAPPGHRSIVLAPSVDGPMD